MVAAHLVGETFSIANPMREENTGAWGRCVGT